MARDLPSTAGSAIRAFLSHPSPVVLALLATGLLATRIALGAWSWWDLGIPLGLAVYWPLHEWLIHVGILHARPWRFLGRSWDLKVAKIHRHHHAEPWDLHATFIPFHVIPMTGIPMIVVAFWLLPAPIATTTLLAYVAYSIHYEWCHFLAHIDWCPPLEFYRRRVQLHRLHHFHHERLWWGVSTIAGDKMLGTGPHVKATIKSATTHDLLGGRWFNHDDAELRR